MPLDGGDGGDGEEIDPVVQRMLLHGVLTAKAARRDFGKLLDVRPHGECPPPGPVENEATNFQVCGYLLEAL